MSIDGDLRQRASITEGDRALALFTDRYSLTRLLAERINYALTTLMLVLSVFVIHECARLLRKLFD